MIANHVLVHNIAWKNKTNQSSGFHQSISLSLMVLSHDKLIAIWAEKVKEVKA